MVRIVSAIFIFLSIPVCFAQPHCSAPRDFQNQDRDKIVGGRRASINNWPGQAALRYRRSSGPFYFCGGTAINREWVLTAAHCVDGMVKGDGDWFSGGYPVEVVIGRDDLRSPDQGGIFRIADVIKHESYVKANRGDDIALIKLAGEWRGPEARVSLIAGADPSLAWITPLMVAGFGLEQQRAAVHTFESLDGKKFEAGSATLLEVTIPLTDEASCKHSYPTSAVGPGQVCAGFVQGRMDSCQGDSGGPLVIFDRYGCPYQIGIVSWGAGCANEKAYGIYTRVSFYATWIRDHTNDLISVALADVNNVTGSSNAAVDAAYSQLQNVLKQASSDVHITVSPSAIVQVGEVSSFTIRTGVSGRLVLIDINAKGEVSQLFPNNYAVSSHLEAGATLTLPSNNFFQFRVAEPIGRSKLIALIVPDDFNIEALNTAKGTKGFVTEAPLPYMQNLLNLIEDAGGVRGIEVRPVNPAHGFGFTSIEYEVVR